MSGFEDFWVAYPRKEAKAACVKKWDQKKLDDRAAVIVAHVKERARTDKKWRDGFIPMPLTFLNQERWTDEYDRIQHRQAETKPAKAEEAFPQPCKWQAAANRILFAVLQAAAPVPAESVARLIARKTVIGRRLAELYGTGECNPKDWRLHSQQAFDWLMELAGGTTRQTGTRESRESASESDAVAA